MGLDGDLSAASRLMSSCRAAHPPPSDEGFMVLYIRGMKSKGFPDQNVVPAMCRWIVRAMFCGCIAFSYIAYCVGLASDHGV